MTETKIKKSSLPPLIVNIGFGNVIASSKIVAIVTPGSSPIKRLRDVAKEKGKLIDATSGRKTRSIIVTDSDHVILSALQAETISQRLTESKSMGKGEED
ncbi:MAG: DUF370 domain-containing protein [Nitrospirae bacterium]|nr:DUF370 domain-containing protein [Nitrospirota bacterium]